MIAIGYFSYALIGSILLALPFFEKVHPTAYLDDIFVAISAVSTTGLVTISISDNYNFWGQLVILILIQLGGIGYMTMGSFIILSTLNRIDLSREQIQRQVFNLPEHISTTKFIRLLIYYTFVVELLGALFLYIFFTAANIPHALWSAIFHSVSAFCTAGFSIYNNSLEPFYGNIGINLTISVLCILGSIGFIIVYDIWNNSIKSKRPISLTSKIILWSTFLLIIFGTVILFFFEPGIAGRALLDRTLTAFFQSMTSLTTAGFNTIPISPLSTFSFFLITLLMVIGASPSGTGGGLKTTTFTALIGVMISSMKGQHDIKFLNRTIPRQRVWLAVSSLCFYLSSLLLSTFLLLLHSGRFNFQQVLFEVASALGTVGLTTGITPELDSIEKIIITATMFIGRIGPMSFGIALFLRHANTDFKFAEEDLAT